MLWRLLLKAWPVILNFIYSYILLCPEGAEWDLGERIYLPNSRKC